MLTNVARTCSQTPLLVWKALKSLNINLYISQFRLAGLEKEGARFVYRKEGNTFANDVEPEYIAFSSDETLAYICLQVNVLANPHHTLYSRKQLH